MTMRVTAMFTAVIVAAGLAVAVSSNPASAATPTTPGAYVGLPATRILDTRTSGVPVAGGTSYALQVTGRAGVPAGAAAVALNVTAVGATATGYVTVHRHGQSAPATSNVNFPVRNPAANLAIAPLSASGKVALSVTSGGRAHLVADVQGYYVGGTPTQPGALVPLTAARLLDTRKGTGAVAGGTARTFRVTGAGGVPSSGVSAVALNITVTGGTGPGYVSVNGKGSAVNFATRQTIANSAIVKPADDGTISLKVVSTGVVHVVVDVLGYYIGKSAIVLPGTTVAFDSVRRLDTRSGAPLATGGVVVLSEGAGNSSAWGLNITVTRPTGNGYLTVYAAGDKPSTSNINFTAGQTIANLVLVRTSPDGVRIRFTGSGTVHVVVDEQARHIPATWRLRPMIATPDGTAWPSTAAPLPVNADASAEGELHDVSCPAPGTCTAVGWYRTAARAPEPLAMSLNGGTWSAQSLAAPVAITSAQQALTSVDCPDVSFCAAVGRQRDGNGRLLVGARVNGTWTLEAASLARGDVVYFPLAQPEVSCGGAGSCVAIDETASDPNTGQAVVLTLADGAWTPTPLPIPDGWAGVASAIATSVACGGPGSCVVTVATHRSRYVAELSGTTWTARQLPLPADAHATEPFLFLTSVSCPAAGACRAVGRYQTSPGTWATAVATLANGTWTTVGMSLGGLTSALPGLDDLDCVTVDYCVATGWRVDPDWNLQAVGVEITAGATAVRTAGLPRSGRMGYPPTRVSCSAAGSCAAVFGRYPLSTEQVQIYERTTLSTLSAGAWTSSPLAVPTTSAPADRPLGNSVSCPTGGSCVAVGPFSLQPGVR